MLRDFDSLGENMKISISEKSKEFSTFIQNQLRFYKLTSIDPVTATQWLIEEGLQNQIGTRPGSYLRSLCRKGLIAGAEKERFKMANKENQKPLGNGPTNQDFTIDPKKILQEAELGKVKEANLDPNKLHSVQERLYKMIDYAVKRQDWYADQCQRLLQIGIGLNR